MARELETVQLKKLLIETYPDQSFGEPNGGWEVLFNPGDYSLSRSNEYETKQASGTSRPSTGFSHGNPDTLDLGFLIDGTGVVGSPGPVTSKVQEFLDLMSYRGSEHKPPYLRLRWGKLDFRCVLKSATVAFTLFDREGEPLRARVSGRFEEVIDERERINTEGTSSPDLYRVWQVEEGDSIDAIAHRVYGDVAYWRAIAEHNLLENPRALSPGLVLSLPPKER